MNYSARGCMYCEGICNKECLPKKESTLTSEDFFRKKLKELNPFQSVIILSKELITAEQGMMWAKEYSDYINKQEKSYIEQEVKYLLEVQRGNCYVALLSHTKNDDIASVALGAPEPGGRNGTWVK